MSSVISIRPREEGQPRGVAWFARSSIFRDVLELVYEPLTRINSELAKLLEDPIEGFGDLHVREWSSSDFTDFARAVRQAKKRLESQSNADRFTVSILEELAILLDLDDRCTQKHYVGMRRIIIDQAVTWEQPDWVYILVTLNLCTLTYSLSLDSALYDFFWQARDQSMWDMRQANQFPLFHEVMETLESYYRHRSNPGTSPVFDEKLYPAAAELYTFYKSTF